eukprot:999475-Rhodomonas_salina.1
MHSAAQTHTGSDPRLQLEAPRAPSQGPALSLAPGPAASASGQRRPANHWQPGPAPAVQVAGSASASASASVPPQSHLPPDLQMITCKSASVRESRDHRMPVLQVQVACAPAADLRACQCESESLSLGEACLAH